MLKNILIKIRDIIFSIPRKPFSLQSSLHIPSSEIEGIPNIFIPWEIFPDEGPDIFRCTQGIPEYWCDHIYIPYWSQLSENEQIKIKRNAPSKEWLDWVERTTTLENILVTKEFHKRHDIPFDYRYYLKDFMIAYANNKILQENSSD